MTTRTEVPLYIRVILPQPLPLLYTYCVPEQWRAGIEPGKRVEVQFGSRRIYAALVYDLCDAPQEISRIKPILSILDESPIVFEQQYRFWEWMASYYVCTMGEVMQAALPAAFKLDSTSVFLRRPDAEYDAGDLSDDAYMVAEAFDFQEELSLEDIQSIVQRTSVSRLIRDLIDRRILYIRETLVERYRPKTEPFVLMGDDQTEEQLHSEMKALTRAPKQQEVLLHWLRRCAEGEVAVPKNELLRDAGTGVSVLKGLVEKGLLRVEYREVDRIGEVGSPKEEHRLEPAQQTALREVNAAFQEHPVVLLHGITSSGKTHVYIECIRRAIESGGQVLYLLPEIALTAQLIRRLRKMLGDVGIYHSRFSDAERIEIWHKVRSGDYKVVIGARSALFLPFQRLSLVIIDEEHDTSFKQSDPAPRYQARDSAIYLAGLHEARVLLGSATPAFETYFNAQAGKYGYVRMDVRYGGVQPPEIRIADLLRARRNESMQGALTPVLSEAIGDILKERGQVILFQNRRGYAPYLACGSCNWIPQCRNCDVSLTYHKFTEDLRCHYCGYRQRMISRCTSCGEPAMELRGMGTERIEDDLKVLFPDARVGRMDLDTVRRKHGHEQIIQQLEEGRIDILVGTQMVTKGLDFENVRLVGVLQADALLYFPDFRAQERAYQILKQVSGRAGRKKQRGTVIIQMSDTQHRMVRYLRTTDGYINLYKDEIAERRLYRYPPFVRLMKVYFRHRDAQTVTEGAQRLADDLRKQWGGRIIGPVKPVIGRIRNLYIRELTIKTERSAGVAASVKSDILRGIDALQQYQRFRSMRVYVDVDAYS